MRRKLVTVCSVVSLLLCVAMCGLWVRSYWVVEVVALLSDRGDFIVQSERGVICVGWNPQPPFDPSDTETAALFKSRGMWGYERYSAVGRGNSVFDTLHFGFGVGTDNGQRLVFFPYAAVVLVTGGIAGRGWMAMRCRSLRIGLCRHCGYDLRGTPDRCPECGTAAESAAA